MYTEILKLAWQALWERKGRTLGAIVGIVIAFTALSYALLTGQTFKDYTTHFFTSNFGANTLLVTGSQFTDADVGVLAGIQGVEAVVPLASTRGVVRVPGSNSPIPVTVYGVNPADLQRVLPSTTLYDGTMFVGSSFALVGTWPSTDPQGNKES